MSTRPTITLSVLLASDAPVGVILRRGPTRQVQVVRWDTRHDTFEDGQWFDGRLYPDRCSVSPDGTLLLYVAQAARWPTDGGSHDSADHHPGWTAISRVPWLTAAVFTPDGPGRGSGGGGRFINDELAIVGRLGEVSLPARAPVADPQWDALRRQRALDGRRSVRPTLDGYVLRLHDGRTGVSLPGVTWAGWDQLSRLVYVRRAALYAATLDGDALTETELANFDDGRRRDWRRCPSWASGW